MDKRINVKFENIIPNISDNNTINPEKSKSIENKSKKPATKPNINVNSKSPDSKKVFKDKKGNVIQPYTHLYQESNKAKGDMEKSIKSINDLVLDYKNFEK